MKKATFTNEYWNGFCNNKEEQGKQISVSLDYGCPVWLGYDLGSTWNGFNCVAFDKPTCDAIAKQWEHDNDEFVLFIDDENGGRYKVYQSVTDWPDNPVEVFEFCGYAPDGSKLYSLGSGSWSWSDSNSCNEYVPQQVAGEQMCNIVDTWCNDKNAAPLGLFFSYDGDGWWTAVDNTTKDCWTESFADNADAIKWLNGEVVEASELPSNDWRMHHDKNCVENM